MARWQGQGDAALRPAAARTANLSHGADSNPVNPRGRLPMSLLMLALAGAGRAGELPESAACRAALDALQAQETTARADPQRDATGLAGARLAGARRMAAQACLGGHADAPLPGRQTQPPVTVPRVIVPPVPLPDPVPAAPALPPRVAAPPVTVIACDAMACFASDGSRLLRAGPGSLLGPRGRCQVQGTVLHCP